MQRSHETIRTHDDGSFGELEAVLGDALEVLAGRVRLTDGTGGQVHHLVPVASNVGVELGYAEMSPVASNHGKDVSEGVGSERSKSARRGTVSKTFERTW